MVAAFLRFALDGAENFRRQAGDDGDGYHQAEGNGATDGNGDVAEQLPGFFLYEHHRNKDGDGGEGAGQDRAPYFAGAVVSGGETGFAHLAVAIDVFQHYDGVVHHHAHREGHARQADYIEGAVKPGHNQEGADNADGDGDGNH